MHAYIRRSAAFLYLTPNGQNPTGTSMPLARKQEVRALLIRVDCVRDRPPLYLSLTRRAHPHGAISPYHKRNQQLHTLKQTQPTQPQADRPSGNCTHPQTYPNRPTKRLHTLNQTQPTQQLYTPPKNLTPTDPIDHQQLYAVAQAYDLLIVEDDPYRLLYLPADPEETRWVGGCNRCRHLI